MALALLLEALQRGFPKPWLALSSSDQRSCLAKAVGEGLRGGALYDALIAITAAKHGAKLLSADRRARPTYEGIGIEVAFIDSGTGA
jgi:predicted nucleic acid-binding protein